MKFVQKIALILLLTCLLPTGILYYFVVFPSNVMYQPQESIQSIGIGSGISWEASKGERYHVVLKGNPGNTESFIVLIGSQNILNLLYSGFNINDYYDVMNHTVPGSPATIFCAFEDTTIMDIPILSSGRYACMIIHRDYYENGDYSNAEFSLLVQKYIDPGLLVYALPCIIAGIVITAMLLRKEIIE